MIVLIVFSVVAAACPVLFITYHYREKVFNFITSCGPGRERRLPSRRLERVARVGQHHLRGPGRQGAGGDHRLHRVPRVHDHLDDGMGEGSSSIRSLPSLADIPMDVFIDGRWQKATSRGSSPLPEVPQDSLRQDELQEARDKTQNTPSKHLESPELGGSIGTGSRISGKSPTIEQPGTSTEDEPDQRDVLHRVELAAGHDPERGQGGERGGKPAQGKRGRVFHIHVPDRVVDPLNDLGRHQPDDDHHVFEEVE